MPGTVPIRFREDVEPFRKAYRGRRAFASASRPPMTTRYVPFARSLSGYSGGRLRTDVIAGVTVAALVGLPALAAVMVRLLIPGAERLRGKRALGAVAVVALTMLVSFGLGTQHPRILTCEDFTISGNFAPETCSPGTGSTVR
jgi:hypothetical protein